MFSYIPFFDIPLLNTHEGATLIAVKIIRKAVKFCVWIYICIFEKNYTQLFL